MAYHRRVLAPMVGRLALDYNLALFTPPRTDKEVALYLYRCAVE